jgi:hypothetical protein
VSDGGDAKRAILARRAKFIAAAMAGLGASGCGKTKLTPPADGGATTYDTASMPRVCLSAWSPPDDAGPPPLPCLSPPAPRPCLSVVRPGNCDVPYTIGTDGQKRYKPECVE